MAFGINIFVRYLFNSDRGTAATSNSWPQIINAKISGNVQTAAVNGSSE
jgi:hypothetical protein